MGRKRGRHAAMVATGLMTAATPLVLGQQPAGAAVTSDHDEAEITFVTESGGQEITCFADLEAIHDTDQPDQPVFEISPSLSGPQGACIDVVVRITASYKDQDGITRTTTVDGTGAPVIVVQGAYTNTTATVDFSYGDCDTSSSSCGVILTASPK
jgi:hypothetical protein